MAPIPNAGSPSLDLDLHEDQVAIADAVSSFCAAQLDLAALKKMQPEFSLPQWQALAQLGVFTPATILGEGGALEICAVSEALGRHVFPGPVAATYLAAQLLQEPELSALVEGRALVSLSNAQEDLLPFGSLARIFLQCDGNHIHQGAPAAALQSIHTLGGEPWARGQLKLQKHQLANADHAFLLHHISSAAYLAAAGLQLVKESADYANVRKQFGKTLGEFQGVAHPLADCQISLCAAQQLARAAACSFDHNDRAQAQRYGAAAKISAHRAALKSAYTCHQVYAGIGITLEGPAFHITRRIRQLASQAPGLAACAEQLLQDGGLGV